MLRHKTETLILSAILFAFLVIGTHYALDTPTYTRPDEPFHFAYVLHLAEGKSLPSVNMSSAAPSGHSPVEMEAHQPPLYYAAVAALSPDFQTGRLVSLAFGAAALLFSYLLVRLFLPWRLALLATVFLGFNPQFIYIATSFSNDMANVATANLGLWQIGTAMQKGLTLRRGIVLGLITALATMAKLGGLGLLLPIGILALWQYWRERRLGPVVSAIVVGIVAVGANFWWFWRNWNLYGDPFAVNVLTVLLPPRTEPISLEWLWSLLEFVWKSYWIDFSPGAVLFAETLTYCLIGLVCIMALVASIIHFAKDKTSRPLFLLTWGWFAIVLVSLIRLTSSTAIFMGGGRLLFPAGVAVATTLAVGLSQLPWHRQWIGPTVAGAFCLFAMIAPGHYLGQAYASHPPIKELPHSPQYMTEVCFGDNQFKLVGYDLDVSSVNSTEPTLGITYHWQALEGSDRDMTVFVQVLNQNRDKWAEVNPPVGYGQSTTSRWRDGEYIMDHVFLPLPEKGSPADGQIITGLFDPLTGNRLRASDLSGKDLIDCALPLAQLTTRSNGDRIAEVRSETRSSLRQPPSHLVGARFGDGQFELIGYDLKLIDASSLQSQLDVTYYWRALRNSDRDFTVFAQLLKHDHGQATLLSQVDTYPGNGFLPTSRWRTDRIIVDRISLPLQPTDQRGTAQVITGLYYQPTLERLLVTDRNGTKADDAAIILGHVNVDPTGRWQLVNE